MRQVLLHTLRDAAHGGHQHANRCGWLPRDGSGLHGDTQRGLGADAFTSPVRHADTLQIGERRFSLGERNRWVKVRAGEAAPRDAHNDSATSLMKRVLLLRRLCRISLQHGLVRS